MSFLMGLNKGVRPLAGAAGRGGNGSYLFYFSLSVADNFYECAVVFKMAANGWTVVRGIRKNKLFK